jgi:hypothetical protein
MFSPVLIARATRVFCSSALIRTNSRRFSNDGRKLLEAERVKDCFLTLILYIYIDEEIKIEIEPCDMLVSYLLEGR